MTYAKRLALGLAIVLAASGCSTGRPNHLPAGEAAYAALAANGQGPVVDDVVRIGDKLSIRVLGEPELTSDDYFVDGNGQLQMPLAGEIPAAGRTSGQLRDEIVQRLGGRFVRNPQVAVILVDRIKTNFAVEGAVREPGVFEFRPDTTLLSAIAQAKSPTNVAELDKVMVFRTVNGTRMGARFNLSEIRRGNAPDPQVLAGDRIVVGHSDLKGAWREFLQAAPLFNLFYVFRNNN